MAGVIWVIVRPWLPGSGLRRAAITGLLAVALGTPAPDPASATWTSSSSTTTRWWSRMLVGLVFAVGFSMALVDGWLDRRMPHSVRRRRRRTCGRSTSRSRSWALFLILPLVVVAMLDQPNYRAPIRAGWALAVVGICTLAWWVLRVRGRTAPPRCAGGHRRAVARRGAVLGVVTILPHIRVASRDAPGPRQLRSVRRPGPRRRGGARSRASRPR